MRRQEVSPVSNPIVAILPKFSSPTGLWSVVTDYGLSFNAIGLFVWIHSDPDSILSMSDLVTELDNEASVKAGLRELVEYGCITVQGGIL
jgi:hypothetical protein